MRAVLSIAGALERVECERLVGNISVDALRPAGLVGGIIDGTMRRADVAWLDDVAGTAWAADRLADVVAQANREAFGFDITDLSESAQVARYDWTDAAHFGWHSDIGSGALAARRKLTVVVQLSDPEDYDGGRLELWPDSTIVTASDAQGSATVFPSYVLHRVTPVSRGTRWSMTLWAHGPSFR